MNQKMYTEKEVDSLIQTVNILLHIISKGEKNWKAHDKQFIEDTKKIWEPLKKWTSTPLHHTAQNSLLQTEPTAPLE